MTGAGLILQPPRAFQIVLYLQFGEDVRSDAELGQYVLSHVNPSLSLAGSLRGVAVQKIATIPTGVPPQ